MLDEYADKMYEQFVSEGGRAARTSLQEERLKLRKEAEREAGARLEQRRQRAERRRGDEEEDTDIEEGRGDGSPLEMVNIVLNRARRRMEDTETETESVDTDATLELHLSDGESKSQYENTGINWCECQMCPGSVTSVTRTARWTSCLGCWGTTPCGLVASMTVTLTLMTRTSRPRYEKLLATMTMILTLSQVSLLSFSSF